MYIILCVYKADLCARGRCPGSSAKSHSQDAPFLLHEENKATCAGSRLSAFFLPLIRSAGGSIFSLLKNAFKL